MMNHGELLRVTSFLNGLARVCQHRANTPESREEFKDTIAQYAAMLGMAGIPAGAYCTESLAYVATGNAWFPPFETIRSRVAEHWAANRPAQAPLLEGPDSNARLSAWDRSWLEYWNANVADRRELEHRHSARIAQMDPPQRPVAMLAGLVRAQSPAAWRAISGSERTA